MDATAKIRELIEPAAEDLGYRVVRVVYGGARRPKLQIMAERISDRGMAIEDCEKLSREVSAILDVADPIAGNYVLEVSSPGIDRPLTRPEDFDDFAGHLAKVTTARQIDGRRRFTGTLRGRNAGGEIVIETDEGVCEIGFADIEKAKLVMTDALLKAHQSNAQKRETE